MFNTAAILYSSPSDFTAGQCLASRAQSFGRLVNTNSRGQKDLQSGFFSSHLVSLLLLSEQRSALHGRVTFWIPLFSVLSASILVNLLFFVLSLVNQWLVSRGQNYPGESLLSWVVVVVKDSAVGRASKWKPRCSTDVGFSPWYGRIFSPELTFCADFLMVSIKPPCAVA